MESMLLPIGEYDTVNVIVSPGAMPPVSGFDVV